MARSSLLQSSAAVALAAMLVAVPALAQTAPGSTPPLAPAEVAAPDQGQEIIVTGTSIRGVAPVGSSIVSVGRAEIEASPSVTTAQLLQETPQVFNFGVSDSSRNGTGGAGNITGGTSINLRGLGPYATLTLVNGHRPVPNGTTAAFVDPSSIPTIALERVEIVPDGASAIYGSDAVAGVANLILRRNVEGVQTQVRYGFGDHYRDFQVSGIAGHKWNTGQVTIAYQHVYRSDVWGRDRDYYKSDLTGRGGTNFTVTQCNPGNIVVGGTSYAIPAGGATRTNLVAGTVNRCDNISYQDIIPRQKYDSASLTFDQEITDRLKLFVDAFASERQQRRRTATATQNLTVPNTNAFFVAPAGTNPTTETVQYSFAGDYGSYRVAPSFSKTYQIFGGLNWDLGHKLNLNGYGSYGYNKDQNISVTTINTAALTTALASNSTATAFNPFGTGANGAGVLDAVGNYIVVNPGREKQWDAGVKLDGPLFALPAGDLRFALGAEYLDLNLVAGQSRGRPDALTGFRRNLSRNVKSTYAEIAVPIVNEDMNIPGILRLDLDVAGRVEKYSDVGSTRNPKVGVNWAPFRGLVVRASYGTSFRAPTLAQISSVSGGQIYLQNYSDPTANNGAGGIIQGVAISGDSNSLTPEKATTWSVGADYDPSFVPNLRLSLNYFHISYRGQIVGLLSNLNVLSQESIYGGLVVRNPSAAFLQALVATGNTINGGTAANVLATRLFVDGRQNNLGTTLTDGLDLQLNYTLPTDHIGTFRFGLRGTRYFRFEVAQTPTASLIERLNTIDYPLKLRGRGSLAWSLGGISATTFVNYSNGYLNNQTTPNQRIKSYTTVDANLGYRFSTGFAKGLRLGLEATNLFDRDPPFANIAPTGNGGGGFDPQNASPIGRVIALTAGFDF